MSLLDDLNADLPDATALAARVRSGRSTALENVSEARARDGAELRVFTHADWDAAESAAAAQDRRRRRGEPPGPLAGVPMTVKDVIAVAGLPLTAASRALADVVARTTAPAVARLQEAGAIVVGKTNCPELAFGVISDSPLTGRTANPRFPGRSPGGSSGGEAAALAAGISALGVGTDFGGSLRWPAQCTGITALRPTAGLVPGEGQVPGAGGDVGDGAEVPRVGTGMQGRLQTIGPLARSVRDLRTALAVMAGATPPASGRPPRRVVWSDGAALGPVRAEVAELMAALADALARAGAAVEERPTLLADCLPAYNSLRAVDPMVDHAAALAGREHLVLPANLETIRTSLAATDADRATARDAADRARRAALAVLADADAFLVPVAGGPACAEDGTLDIDGVPRGGWELMGQCRAVTLTGAPAVSVPVGVSVEGLPLSVQVVCAPGRDLDALAVAEHVAAVATGLLATR